MKRIFIYLLILLLFIFTFNILQKYNIIYTTAYSIASSLKTVITNEMLENYKSTSIDKKKKAEKKIKEVCLNNLQYHNWKKYIDYIDMKLYFSNIIPDEGDELTVTLNFSKDNAAICIFKEQDQNYIFYDKIENLLPVENIKFIKIPGKNYNLLAIYQIADERLGAFYFEKFLEIYMFKNSKFEELWKETVYVEEIYKSRWTDKNAPINEWTKNVIENNIDFIKNSTLEIIVSGTKKTYKAKNLNTIPSPNKFKLIDTIIYKNKYFWNSQFENFSLFNKTVSFYNKPVIVIGDSNLKGQSVHNYFNNKYKILTISDKIIYVNKNVLTNNQ